MAKSDPNKSESKGRRRWWISSIRIVLAVVVVLLMLRISGCTERLVFAPSTETFQTPRGYEDVSFSTADGLTLHGWFIPAHGERADGALPPVVLHCHGNAGNVSSHSYFSSFLPKHGVSVFLFDYRGYGRSEPGALRKKTLMRDTDAALDYLLTRDDIDHDRIGVYGVSLGGAFALPLAARRDEIRFIVTMSTFATWRGAAADMAPVIGPLLYPGGFDPIDSVDGLGDKPWLIVHGSDDAIINRRHAQLLADEAARLGVPCEMKIARGGSHNSIFEQDPALRNSVAAYILNNSR